MEAVTYEDLVRLVDTGVEEGLMLEYKRDWVPDKVARAIASFANSRAGGTLIVGVDEERRVATSVPGCDFRGDLAESVVQVVRDHIAPIPTFKPVVVDTPDGRHCLVVEVPPGTQPPYLLLRHGAVLSRTATGSTPATREELDVLFGVGQRGSDWAADRATEMRPILRDHGLDLITIPEVAQGLPTQAMAFRRSTVEFMKRLLGEGFAEGATLKMRPDQVQVMANDMGEEVGIRLYANGIVYTYAGSEGAWKDLFFVQEQLEKALPRHRRMIEELLGHRGFVTLLAGGKPRAERTHANAALSWSRVSVSDLDSDILYHSVRRQFDRSLHKIQFDPEPEA